MLDHIILTVSSVERLASILRSGSAASSGPTHAIWNSLVQS